MSSELPAKRTAPASPVFVAFGCTCGVIVAAIVIAFISLSIWAYRKGENFKREMADPIARTEKSRAILPWTELPEGYYPMGGFSLAFAMKMAMFSDHNPAPGEPIDEETAFDKGGFVFVNMRNVKRSPDLDDFFSGQAETTSAFDTDQIRLGDNRTLGHGTFSIAPAEVAWVAQEGEIQLNNKTIDGLVDLFHIRCPERQRLRLGVWFGPKPVGETGTGELEAVDQAGSLADPAAMQEFLSHFDLCH